MCWSRCTKTKAKIKLLLKSCIPGTWLPTVTRPVRNLWSDHPGRHFSIEASFICPQFPLSMFSRLPHELEVKTYIYQNTLAKDLSAIAIPWMSCTGRIFGRRKWGKNLPSVAKFYISVSSNSGSLSSSSNKFWSVLSVTATCHDPKSTEWVLQHRLLWSFNNF